MTILDTFSILFTSNAGALRKELSDTEKAYENLKKKIDQTADEKKKMAELEASVKTLRGELEKYDTAKGKLGSSLLTLGAEAISGYAAWEGLKAGFQNAQSLNLELDKISKLTGQNAEEVLLWDRALKQVGGSAGDFSSFFVNYSKRLQATGLDTKNIIPNLKQWNHELAGLDEKSARLRFQSISMANGGLPDFLFPLLRMSPEKLNNLLEEQKKFIANTKEGEEAARRLSDAWSNAGNAILAVFTKVLNWISPALTNIGNEVAALFSGDFKKYWDIVMHGSGGESSSAPSSGGASVPTSGSPLGIRSNNPGNLQPGGREAVFPSLSAGISAEQNQLQRYGQRGINTLRGIAQTWSGGASGYLEALVKATGFSPDQQLDLTDKDTLAKVANAINRQENGSSYGSLVGAAQDSINLADKSNLSSFGGASGTWGSNNSMSVGEIHVHTQATDADGIASAINDKLNYHFRNTVSNYDDMEAR